MSRRRDKQYDDDDGRTIADMGGMDGPGLFLPRKPPEREPSPRRTPQAEENPVPPGERRGMVWMALRAGLLIGMVFLVGLGLLIALMLFFWS